jgi:hypothetical protein
MHKRYSLTQAGGSFAYGRSKEDWVRVGRLHHTRGDFLIAFIDGFL